MRESKIEGYLRTEIKKLGGVALKFTSPGRRGVPDRIVIMPGGRVYFVELKAPKGKLRPAQQRAQGMLREYGCCVWTLYQIIHVDMFTSYIQLGKRAWHTTQALTNGLTTGGAASLGLLR